MHAFQAPEAIAYASLYMPPQHLLLFTLGYYYLAAGLSFGAWGLTGRSSGNPRTVCRHQRPTWADQADQGRLCDLSAAAERIEKPPGSPGIFFWFVLATFGHFLLIFFQLLATFDHFHLLLAIFTLFLGHFLAILNSFFVAFGVKSSKKWAKSAQKSQKEKTHQSTQNWPKLGKVIKTVQNIWSVRFFF